MRNLKHIRLKQYDYGSNGYYFVTIVTDLRLNYFKDKEKEVERELRDLVSKTEGLELDLYVIMPNHVHIIFVLKSSTLKLGEIVRRFKAKVSHALEEFIWQPNYYEHIIRNENALNKIREYILKNPTQEIVEFKKFYE
ncbi:MAG: transposase [Candidatus Doudnabacteria bacterium]|nr:transposase [Candidatus Doudnabacteria bacterium]